MVLKYLIGTSSYTNPSSLDFLNKQFKIDVPLITGATITSNKNNINLYVGKEFNRSDYVRDFDIISKYDLDLEELAGIYTKGYKKAVLLNYKKYEPVLIGINDNDIVVPDYYALRNEIVKLIK